MRATEVGAFPLKKSRFGQDGILDRLWIGIELGLEGVEERDDPFHDSR